MIKSFSRIEGVVGSPTKYTVNPKCIKRLENARAAKPERPAPAMKILFAFKINASTFSAVLDRSAGHLQLAPLKYSANFLMVS